MNISSANYFWSVLIGLVLAPSVAIGTPTTVTLQGMISRADTPLNSEFPPGTPAELTYTYDSNDFDFYASGTESNRYWGISRIEVILGERSQILALYQGNGGGGYVSDNRNYGNPEFDVEDLYIVTSGIDGPDTAGLPVWNVQLRFGERGAPPVEMVTDALNDYRQSLPQFSYFAYSVLQFEGFHNLWFAFTSASVSTSIRVEIDIQPAEDDNCAKIDGNGVIPVAVFGSSEFDASQIDQTTLRLGGLGVRLRGQGKPQCAFEDSNGDAYMDLICQFSENLDEWESGDQTVLLTGTLISDGTVIEGTDAVCVVP